MVYNRWAADVSQETRDAVNSGVPLEEKIGVTDDAAPATGGFFDMDLLCAQNGEAADPEVPGAERVVAGEQSKYDPTIAGQEDLASTPDAPPLTLAERVATMQESLGLPEDIVKDLLDHAGAAVVVIADDSSSMNEQIEVRVERSSGRAVARSE